MVDAGKRRFPKYFWTSINKNNAKLGVTVCSFRGAKILENTFAAWAPFRTPLGTPCWIEKSTSNGRKRGGKEGVSGNKKKLPLHH